MPRQFFLATAALRAQPWRVASPPDVPHPPLMLLMSRLPPDPIAAHAADAADADTGQAQAPAGRAQRHWRGTRRLTGLLLLVWGLVSFVLPWNARALNFNFFGWPFSFWVAAQGAMLVFLLLVVVYAVVAGRLDRAHGFDEPA